MIHPAVKCHIPAIRDLCREFGVARLEIFGSAVTGAFDPDRSDVDFVVTYPAGYDMGPWASRYQELQERLADVVQREVDLALSGVPRNRFFARELDRTRRLVYDADNPETISPDVPLSGPPNIHQRTLKLLEDIRLWCADVIDIMPGNTATASREDRLLHDAIAMACMRVGRGCLRLVDADRATASRCDPDNLSRMIQLADDLAYGSGVEFGTDELLRMAQTTIPSLQSSVEMLISELEE